LDKKFSIIQTAITHFSEKGISGTRIADIADDLNISKKTLYLAFQSKHSLIESSFDQLLRQIDVTLDGIAYTSTPLSEKLGLYIEAIYNLVQPFSEITISEIRTDFPELSEKIKEFINNSIFNRYLHMLEKGQEQGELREGLSPTAAALIYRDAVTNYLTNRMKRDLPVKLTMQSDKIGFLMSYMMMIFRGLLTDNAAANFDHFIQQHPILSRFK